MHFNIDVTLPVTFDQFCMSLKLVKNLNEYNRKLFLSLLIHNIAKVSNIINNIFAGTAFSDRCVFR